MRSKKALINAVFSIAGYIILMLSNLLTRSVLVDVLGLQLAGIDSTFKNFLSFLSLAELGIGTGLIYKLYQPILENDNNAIKRILNFYKQAYLVISLVFMTGAIIIAFFTWTVIKENINPLFSGCLFLLYAGDTVTSYLYANRKALIVADQKNYLVSRNDAFISILSLVVQVTLLKLLPVNKFVSFIIYASVKILCRFLGTLFISSKFKKLYPEIYQNKSKESLSGKERKDLLKNMSAMLMHRIGAVSVTATGTALISAFINLETAGIYGNYMLIVSTINMMILQVFNGITASFGQFSASENDEAIRKKFNTLYFCNFLIMAFCCTSFVVLIQPFIKIWVGDISLFSIKTVILFAIYLFIVGLRRVVIMTKDSAGLFRPDRYFSILEAVINIILSIALIKKFGVNGLITANIISMLIIPTWLQPYFVYKLIIKNLKKLYEYYFKFIIYAVVAALEIFICYKISLLITVNSLILELLLKAIICILLPNIFNLLIFIKTDETKDLFKIAKNILKSFKKES